MTIENKRRDHKYGALVLTEEKIDGMRLGMYDKIDLENLDFRCPLSSVMPERNNIDAKNNVLSQPIYNGFDTLGMMREVA